jgi:hypothetical protein
VSGSGSPLELDPMFATASLDVDLTQNGDGRSKSKREKAGGGCHMGQSLTDGARAFWCSSSRPAHSFTHTYCIGYEQSRAD